MPTPAQLSRRSTSLALAAVAACAPHTAPAPSPRAEPPQPAAATDTAAASHARALALLERSVQALGGRDAVHGARGFEVMLESRAARGNWRQARRWTDTLPNPEPTRVRYLVDVERRRGIQEFASPAPGDIWFHYRTYYDTAGAWQVDLMRWRLGTDADRGTGAEARPRLAAALELLPHTLVRQASRAGRSLRFAGERARDGRRLEAVTYADPIAGRAVTLELDAATAEPAFVTVGSGTVEFADYRAVDGVRVPWRRVQSSSGVVVGEQRVVRLDLHPALDDARFALPAGYADAPARGTPRATRIADGVYRLDDMPNGYHAVFVVQPRGVVVLEAPQDSAYTAAALRVIGETAPGLPVTHVLVTHHHADHVGGLAPYVARGATIAVGAGLEEAIRRQLPDSLRGRARIVPAAPGQLFGAGASRVEALPVPNTHADGNVAYFLPASGVLFQGDLFYIPERGEVPPAFPVTADLALAVRQRGVRVSQVVGVHGRTGTWADVEASLRNRAARPSLVTSATGAPPP